MSLEFDCDYYHEDPSSLAYELGYAPVYTKLDDSIDPVIRSSFSSPSPSSFEESSDSSSSDQDSDRSFSVPSDEPVLIPQGSESWHEFLARTMFSRAMLEELKAEPETMSPALLMSRSISPEPVSPVATTLCLPRRKRRLSHSSIFGDGESDSDDSDKDGDYTPESDAEYCSSGSRKRRRPTPTYLPHVAEKKPKASALKCPAAAFKAPKASKTLKRPSADARPTIKLPTVKLTRSRPPGSRPRVAPPSRNKQVEGLLAERVRALLCLEKSSVPSWECPACDWTQTNERLPDFKRHLRTHLRDVSYRCCGVPYRDAEVHGVPADAVPYAYEGDLKVGGCMLLFSRLDALVRHVKHSPYCFSEHYRK